MSSWKGYGVKHRTREPTGESFKERKCAQDYWNIHDLRPKHDLLQPEDVETSTGLTGASKLLVYRNLMVIIV